MSSDWLFLLDSEWSIPPGSNIGSLKYVFYDYMYSNFTFTFSIFIESLGDRDSLFVSIGTLISFFIGEIVEYINNKSNS